MHELRGTPWELKPGSRRSAPGLPRTSFTIAPTETASPVEETSQRQQVEQVVLPQPPTAQQAKTQPRGSPKANDRPRRVDKLHVTEALAQTCGPTLGCELCHWGNAVNMSHDAACRQRITSPLCQPRILQEKPEERVTPVAVDTGPEPASSSPAAADMETQLPATDKRAVGTVDGSGMEDGRKESKRARTIGGVEVCVLDDNYDE